ncbi:MAG: nucleotidyltransferase domain-containing protein [Planctomycetota bacterium]
MKPKDYEIARELKERLSGIIDLVDFRIFGSRARGDDEEYSDLDVFMEVEVLDKQLKAKIFDIIWETGFEHSIVISSLIFSRDEIEKSPLRASPLVMNIVEEGIIV